MNLTLLLSLLAATLFSQPSLFDVLYAEGDTVSISLDTDWSDLLRHKEDKNYQPAILRIGGSTIPGRVRTRGHARLESCTFPSLKVKLDKPALESLGYSDLNDLKLVLQCTPGSGAEGYLRRERLMYELHAVVSDYYHRTVPVRLTATGGKSLQAFLVETEEQLEARFGGPVLESDRVSSRAFDRAAYLNLCLFNYLILNTDWHIYNLHNVEGILPAGANRYLPIPYDFDYSGLVGTDYAVPRPSLEMLSIAEPRFLGQQIGLEELRTAALHFLSKRDALEGIVNAYPGLHPRRKRAILKRMDQFFAELSDERLLARLTDD